VHLVAFSKTMAPSRGSGVAFAGGIIYAAVRHGLITLRLRARCLLDLHGACDGQAVDLLFMLMQEQKGCYHWLNVVWKPSCGRTIGSLGTIATTILVICLEV